MQNFTLGKKGISMLFFAFILLIGSSPSFGQNCPTVEDTTQEFCYLATVSDLQATANGDEVRWYRSATSTNPIPANELLQTDTYFAGNQSNTCAARVPVEVTIDNFGPPTTQFGNFFQPCEYSSDDTSTAQDLINNVNGNQVEIFADEFGSNALDPSFVLIEGNSYFAGQRNPDTNCRTSRIALRYDPVLTEAPTGESAQTFCQNATVADLMAQATSEFTQAFRWYSTATSNPSLSSSTPLINGETYFASQIVNRNNSALPPCESQDRFAVTVTLNPAAFNESTQRFCESIGEGNNFDVPRVENLSPSGATWFAEEDSTEPLDPQTELVDGEDYFNRDNGSECSQDRVVVELFPTPNAGSTTATSFCENDEPENLVDRINDSQLGAPDQTGSFSPALSTGTNIFNPADYEPGSYTFTYTVEGNEDCPTDNSQITVTVEASPNAGEPVNEEVCSAELSNFEALLAEFSTFLEGRDTGGTFEPTLESLFTQYSTSKTGTFTTVYTVGAEGECQDSAQFTVTVLQSPNAGEDGSVELSREDAPFNLFTELEGTPDAGGTWSPGNADGSFDPATGEAGTYTYTVTSGDCSDTATVSVSFENECPVVENTTQSFCQSIGEGNNFRKPQVSDLMPAGATWYATADSEDALASNTELVDGSTYFAGNSQGTCSNRTPVLVNLDQAPNAGSTTAINVCSNDAPFDVVNRINPSILGAPDSGGTFSPAFASGTTIFDPAVDAAGTYTYTVQSENDACPNDSSNITINITNVDAGENGSVEVTREDAPFNLFTELEGTPDAGGTWSPGNADGSFDPATGEQGTYTYTVTNGSCTDTATVTVTITEEIECPVVADNEQAFCASIGEGNNSRRPTVSDLMPTGAIWYATATSTDALATTTNLIDGEDYFAGNANGNCTTRERVVVTIDQAPNAGRTTALNVCSSEAPFDLVTRINESVLGAPDAGGTFTPALASGTTIFDPAVDAAGNYTYTVQSENEACADDTSSITITITDGTVGAPINETLCSAELTNVGDFVNEFSSLLEGRDTGGTFAPTLETLFVQYTTNPIGTFTTVYTVGAEGECQSSVEISVTVQESPNAGEDGTVEVSREDAPFNLFTELNGTPDTGGIWSPGNAEGSFNPATGEQGTYTYTVTNGSCTDTATVTVTITEEIECPVVADNEQAFCASIGEGNNSRRPTVTDLRPTGATWYATATSTDALATTTILIDGEDYFAGNANGNCTTRERVVVTIDQAPNAGRTTNITVCSTDASFNLVSRINESILGAPDAGGTFTPALASGTNIFNPAVDVAGTYTYTVESENDACPADDAVITVNITQGGPANAGDDVTATYCVDENTDVQLSSLLSAGANTNGTFSTPFESGVFNPSVAGEGEYVITYTVDEDVCITGTDTSTITITVTGSAEAPVADAQQSFCIVDSPTVADLEAEGENVVWYTDAAGTTVAPDTTELTNGAVFYAISSTGDSECETSDPVMVTVTLNDSVSPTIPMDGNEFCRQDNPTVQNLINNLSGTAINIYSSATGGTAIPVTTALQNGTTYYATSTSSTTGCESSERRAVTVKVLFCGIPEGFSPNGDGINDRFVIEEIATDYPNYTIEIFNRWGNVVFKGNASTPDWDGISNQSTTLGDNVLPAGVYFYILNYNDGQTDPVQGKLYLSR